MRAGLPVSRRFGVLRRVARWCSRCQRLQTLQTPRFGNRVDTALRLVRACALLALVPSCGSDRAAPSDLCPDLCAPYLYVVSDAAAPAVGRRFEVCSEVAVDLYIGRDVGAKFWTKPELHASILLRGFHGSFKDVDVETESIVADAPLCTAAIGCELGPALAPLGGRDLLSSSAEAYLRPRSPSDLCNVAWPRTWTMRATFRRHATGAIIRSTVLRIHVDLSGVATCT